MTAVHWDSGLDDEARRRKLYEGDLFVYSPTPASIRLVELAARMSEEAFAPHDPREAQHHLPVEEFAAILAQLKPRFIHHPDCKTLIRDLLSQRGCDPEKTYFDVPRLRTAASGDYLTSGIAYAFHPHRDTWYSAPFCQINWWMPVYDIESENSMAFHPYYFDHPLKNGSARYNYYAWNRENRRTAAQHIKSDTRDQPRPEEPIAMEPQIRLLPRPGGLILFSGAQLHSTVPNTSGRTRFSIDFRTVHLEDVLHRRGAKNIDSSCTGTSLRDFLRGSDTSRIPEDAARLYDVERPPDGDLVYRPELTS
jgi:hypothetical protein